VVLNILHGNIEYIQEKPIGTLVISVEGEEKELEKAVDYLNANIGQVYNFIERKDEAV
jgi:D-methionine transport system ATP-binding protein